MAIQATVEAYEDHMTVLTLESAGKLSDADFETAHAKAHEVREKTANRIKLLGVPSVQKECRKLCDEAIDRRKQYYAKLNAGRRDHKAEVERLRVQFEQQAKLSLAAEKAALSAKLEAEVVKLRKNAEQVEKEALKAKMDEDRVKQQAFMEVWEAEAAGESCWDGLKRRVKQTFS